MKEENTENLTDDSENAAEIAEVIEAEVGAAEADGVAEAQTLIGDDKEEAADEIAVTDIGTYGDHIIEDLSAEANVLKISKYTKMPLTVAKYVLSVLYIALGAVCAAIPAKIENALPYIVGGGLGALSLVQFIFAIVQKEYRKTQSNRTASSLILIGLSVMIIIEHEWAHTFIPIVWGILGLCEGAHAFNLALSRISRGLRSTYYIIKGIIEVVVAFLLLYRPEQYGELHIIVFGVSLIIDGIVTVPVIKKFVTRE